MKIDRIARISLSIVLVCLAAIVFCQVIGVIPDDRKYETEYRMQLSESLAASVGHSLGSHDIRQAGRLLELFADQNEELISTGLRRLDGELIVDVGGHKDSWRDAFQGKSDGVYVVPIGNRQSTWGELEIQFEPLYVGVNQFFSDSMMQLLCIVGLIVGMASWLHLKRILRYLDPSLSVPPRVREVLNSFAEGVVVLDDEDRIVLVNETFAQHVSLSQDQLLGTKLSDLSLIVPDSDVSANEDSPNFKSKQMQLADENGRITTIFSVNSSPVLDDNGENKGVMLAFTDVTPLERNRAALISTLQDLSQSKKAITEQNEELRYLATRDPLTSCINRRTFFEQFENHWNNAKTMGIPLAGIMVDIDFFKPINDNYGHSMGDEVLRQTGALLNDMTRKEDIVCRYGGEEFAILMPGLPIEQAEEAAESIRIRMSEMQFPEFTITASLGISGFGLGADGPQDMLDQADKCLYVAKRNGRNQVVRFDTVPTDLIVDESKISRTKPAEVDTDSSPSIPFAAVSALLSALTFRDAQTGAHSSRVSTFAALLAQRVMSPKDVYVVEIAAMLHDIGKVGVPDAILLKPDKLTPEEWTFMEKHDRIGVEIIKRSFSHEGLTEIVKYHHYQFADVNCDEKQQSLWGADIPLGARILTIADSFDAMVSDRPYRKGMPVAEALLELRRYSGTQFDPELVEHFIRIVESGCSIDSISSQGYGNDVALSIGEQVERLVEAADNGDGPTFIALAERLRSTALQYNVDSVADAATHAIEVASEDAQLDQLVEESFELLAACRLMRVNLAETFQVS